MTKAQQLASEMGDQYISLEHIFMAIVAGKEQTARLLKDNGVTEKDTKAAVLELRKGSNVNSQSAEDSYDSLNRYAINLNERARN